MRTEAYKDALATALKGHLRDGKPPQLPEGAVIFWNIFMQIAATRTHHGHGPLAISYQEIEAWARLNRHPLQPHHVDILRAMDDAWLDHALSKLTERSSGTPILPRSSQHELSGALFDLMFQ